MHDPSPSAPVFTNLNIQPTHPSLVREQTRHYPTYLHTPQSRDSPYKHLIGPKLRARILPAQLGEAAVAVAVLNTMMQTAKLASIQVA